MPANLAKSFLGAVATDVSHSISRLGLSAGGFQGPREMLRFRRGPLNGIKLRCAG